MHNLHKLKITVFPLKICMHTLYKVEILYCSQIFFHGNGHCIVPKHDEYKKIHDLRLLNRIIICELNNPLCGCTCF